MAHPIDDNPPALRSLRRLAHALDSAVPLPGGFRVGADGILGLIPGYGDALGALLSGYIIVQAARLGVPTAVLARMGLNVGVESLVGAVPIVGDLFDFVWKSNEKNLALVEASLQDRTTTRHKSTAVVVLATIAVVVLLTIPLLLAIWLLKALWLAVFGA